MVASDMDAIVVNTGRMRSWPPGEPFPILNCYRQGRGPEWVINAHPSRGGSYCGVGRSREEALARAIEFLTSCGELDPLFAAFGML